MFSVLSEALFAFFCVGYFLLNFGECQAVSMERFDKADSDDKNWIDIDYRPVRFSDLIYKAQVLQDRVVDVLDGPILLENPPKEVFFVITSDNHINYVLTISNTRTPTTQLEVKLELSKQPVQKEIDIVVVEVLDVNLHALARTTILIVHGEEYDPYRVILKAESGQDDFIILNRFYFKIFLILLLSTAMMLWIVEMHDILRKLKYRKQKQSAKYSILQNV